jgi:hypothetical protein
MPDLPLLCIKRYSIEGSGQGIAVGLCSEMKTNFDTKISVFEGFCDELVCVGGNDDWCKSRNIQFQLQYNENIV